MEYHIQHSQASKTLMKGVISRTTKASDLATVDDTLFSFFFSSLDAAPGHPLPPRRRSSPGSHLSLHLLARQEKFLFFLLFLGQDREEEGVRPFVVAMLAFVDASSSQWK